jgi:predicted transcriptional regulator
MAIGKLSRTRKGETKMVDQSTSAKTRILNVVHRAKKAQESGTLESWTASTINSLLIRLAQKGITDDKSATNYLWEHRYEQEGSHTQIMLENLAMELIGTKF